MNSFQKPRRGHVVSFRELIGLIIHVSGQREQDILYLVQSGKFASAHEVIDEGLPLVRQLHQESETKEPANEKEIAFDHAKRQRENLKRLGRKLEAMPMGAVDDELSNRDHDWILYTQ